MNPKERNIIASSKHYLRKCKCKNVYKCIFIRCIKDETYYMPLEV